MGSNIDDQIIAGTNINTNPGLPAPKIVKTEGMESGLIEVPLSNDRPVPPPTKPPKIKKEVHLREIDNGYVIQVYSGPFNEEWCFGTLNKAIRTIVAFLNTTEE